MFSALLSPNSMASFRKIVGAFFEICCHVRTYARTYARTDGAYFIDPRFSNWGPTSMGKWSPGRQCTFSSYFCLNLVTFTKHFFYSFFSPFFSFWTKTIGQTRAKNAFFFILLSIIFHFEQKNNLKFKKFGPKIHFLIFLSILFHF